MYNAKECIVCTEQCADDEKQAGVVEVWNMEKAHLVSMFNCGLRGPWLPIPRGAEAYFLGRNFAHLICMPSVVERATVR